MKYCLVQYAGFQYVGQKAAGIYCEGASPTINHCTIRYNNRYGIRLTNASPSISNNTISNHNQYGIWCEINANPIISESILNNNQYCIYTANNSNPIISPNNRFISNSSYALYNGTSTIAIDARNNYWGSDTGPTHESNLDGTGGKVSDNVQFSPWLTSEVDSDADGMSDVWETKYGLNPQDASDANNDPDDDGLSSLLEFQKNTNPHNSDTDGDGFSDGYEVAENSDPCNKNSIPNRHLAIYYGWPSAVNDCADLECAINVFKQFRVLIFGDGLEHNDHGDHDNTVNIINALHTPPNNTTIYGYIDLGISTSDLPIATVKQYVDEWLNLGADGIFLDDAGWDFQVNRSRLIEAVEYIHEKDMVVILNAWNPDDVLSGAYNEAYNPDSLPTPLQAGDGYLSESYQITQGECQDLSAWATKADKCLDYKNNLGISIYAVATGDNTGGDSVFEQKYDYFWWSFIIYGFDYFQYTNFNYSASNGPTGEPWANNLIFHPAQSANYIYKESIITHTHEDHCHTRPTINDEEVYIIGDGQMWGKGGISQPLVNIPPIIYSPNPIHEAENQPFTLTLSWTAIDPDEAEVTCSLYLGQDNNLSLIYAGEETSFSLSDLNPSATYKWQVKITDNQGEETPGPIWNFTTQALEICDGVDNDGDGEIDEDFSDLGQTCTVGIGECEATGIMICNQDGSGSECDAIPLEPSDEICNDEKDNDCDGQVDEDCDFLCGDADGNEVVDIFDALMVSEYDAGLKTADELPGFFACDVDKNGTVDIFDALMISEYDAGLVMLLECMK